MSDERPCIRVTDSFELKEDNPHGRNCLNRLRLSSLFHIKHEYQESIIQGRITINRPRTKTSAVVVITTAQVHSTKEAKIQHNYLCKKYIHDITIYLTITN